MSLTQHLKNPNSDFFKWFEQNLKTPLALQLMDAHNRELATHPAMSRYANSNLLAVGGAMTYLFTWSIAPKEWYKKSVMWNIRRARDFITEAVRLGDEKPIRRPALSYLFYLIDQEGRTGTTSDLVEGLMQKGLMQLPAMAGQGIEHAHTIRDLVDMQQCIVPLLPLFRDSIVGKLEINATFNHSETVGGADAQLIVGSTMFDTRTTRAKQPFTLKDWYQQMGYAILDTDDEYKLSHIAWVYPRQGVAFYYKMETLLPNLEQLRLKFDIEFGSEGYDDDDDYGWESGYDFGHEYTADLDSVLKAASLNRMFSRPSGGKKLLP